MSEAVQSPARSSRRNSWSLDAPETSGAEPGPRIHFCALISTLGFSLLLIPFCAALKERHWHAYSFDLAIPAVILCSHD